jgi:hypothetical protein
MVFENLTLFELHLEDAQFGPTSLPDLDAVESAEESGEEPDQTAAGGSRRRGLALLLASVAVSLVATVVARRLAGADDADEEADAEHGVAVER